MTPIYIPLDLLISILLRLPVKSLWRFRCVSKLWSSIITSRDFRKLHLSITAPPRLLIAFEDFYGDKLLVVSTPNPNAHSSSSSSPNKDLILVNLEGNMVCNVGRGLICVGARYASVGICNPSTRQLHTFPQQTPQSFVPAKYIFGYHPVKDLYKVLAVRDHPDRMEHNVVVLGGEEAWREAPCVACPHVVWTRGLYMNGTVYYGALSIDNNDSIIVCFDVRLETFNIIKLPIHVVPTGYDNVWVAYPWVYSDKTLINYGGTIGVVENPREGSFRMWVLQDSQKEEWSMNTLALPESAAGLDFRVMETFSTGEICLVPKTLSDPFCLFYYNLEEKSMRSVTMEGLPISELKQVEDLSVTVSDHYENLMSFET